MDVEAIREALAALPKAAGLPWHVTVDSAERGEYAGDAEWLCVSPYEDDPTDTLLYGQQSGEITPDDEAIVGYAVLAANAVPDLLAALNAAEARARALEAVARDTLAALDAWSNEPYRGDDEDYGARMSAHEGVLIGLADRLRAALAGDGGAA